MGNCPSCGAELGFGIAFCPNCGGEIAGDSMPDDGHHDDIIDDGSGDTIDHGVDSTTAGQGRVPEPDSLEPEEFAESWVADEAVPHTPPKLDHSAPGSEIPPSHGGGFQQQGEDGTAPQDMIYTYDLDRPADDIPERPEPELDLDESTRRFPPRFNAGLVIAVLILVIIVALAGWYIWTGGDDGDGNGNGEGNGEPNGDGDDPKDALHIYKDGTSGTYPYEPPGEYHITVALRNNGSKSVDLAGHTVSVTIWIDWVRKGFGDLDLSGSIGAGEIKTFDIVVGTELLGGGDEITVGISLHKDDGDTHVHTINYEQTL